MTVTSTGTGALTLGVALTGYQTFAASGVADGDPVGYAIEDGAFWEIGTGTYTSSGTTLSRTVTASSNSGSAISVTTNAQVFITALAADLVNASNLTSGTVASAQGGAGTVSGIMKANGSGTVSAATAGTDYLSPPSGTAILKANSGGALANAAAGTDYVAPGGDLGTPSSGTLTSCTGLPISTGVSGLGTGVATAASNAVNASGGLITYSTFAPASGKTLTVSNSITLAGTDSTTMTFPGASASIGYLNVPQVGGAAKTSSYTAVLADSGQMIVMNGASLTATIPANSSVAYAVGTVLTFVNIYAGNLSIAITTDTMTLVNSTTTGTRTLAQNGVATAVKVTSTSWIISGSGLT